MAAPIAIKAHFNIRPELQKDPSKITYRAELVNSLSLWNLLSLGLALSAKVMKRPVLATIIIAASASFGFYNLHSRIQLKRKDAKDFNHSLISYAKYRDFAEQLGPYLKETIGHLLPSDFVPDKLTFKAVEVGQSDIEVDEYASIAMRLLYALIRDIGIPKAKLKEQGYGAPNLVKFTEFRPPRLDLKYEVEIQKFTEQPGDTGCPVCIEAWSTADKESDNSDPVVPYVSTAHRIHPVCKGCIVKLAQGNHGTSVTCPICRQNIAQISLSRKQPTQTHLEELLGHIDDFQPFAFLLNHSPTSIPENFTQHTELGGSGSKATFSATGYKIFQSASLLLSRTNLFEKEYSPTLLKNEGFEVPEARDIGDEDFILSYYTRNQTYAIAEFDTDIFA